MYIYVYFILLHPFIFFNLMQFESAICIMKDCIDYNVNSVKLRTRKLEIEI